jgi:ABC-2 type transport system ATP-binding protein
MPRKEDSIISIKNLTRQFRDVKAVDDLSIDAKHGDVYGFLGPNGSGKSTTIRLMLGLVKPDAGQIEIFGKNLSKHRHEVLSKTGALIEKPDFYEYLSAERNLQMLVRYGGFQVEKHRIEEVLELVGLKERAKSRVGTYSKGMKQRLGIAQAILHDPELIILDEPGSGLDPSGIKDIRELILYLNRDLKKTIFLSSHLLYEVELIANRMVIINRGKKVVEGQVKELLDNFEVKTLFGVEDPEMVLGVLKQSEYEFDELGIENGKLVVKAKREVIPMINQFLVNKGIAVESIQKVQALEEYFMTIT